MKTIGIDDQVYSLLESKALPFIETTPNMTLRRLLGLDKLEEDRPPNNQTRKSKKKKQPKVQLRTLIKRGALKEGQPLFLYNYRGEKISGYIANLKGEKLESGGMTHSMSELAKIFLKLEGYQSNSVRGPAHWYTNDGVSVSQLWEAYLKNNDTI